MSLNQSLLDVHEIHRVSTLVPTDSASSSIDNTSSPTTLTRESSVRGSICPSPNSSPSTPTVKFAPLPQINPNRKRSLAPLGVPARSRRIPIVEVESGSLLWPNDGDAPENMEDPLIAFARFIKKTSKTLWRRVRKGSLRVAPREDEPYSTEPVLDITSSDCPDDVTAVGKGQCVFKGSEDKRGRPASWSPSAECRRLDKGDDAKRRSTSDLSNLSVVP